MSTAFAAAKAALVAAVPLANPALPSGPLPGDGRLWQPHWSCPPATGRSTLAATIGFYSKNLSKTKTNYSTFERELLAIVSGIKHFCSRLEGRPFQLWTAHKLLLFTLTRVSPPGIHVRINCVIQRLAIQTSNVNYIETKAERSLILASFSISKLNKPAYSEILKDRSEANNP